LSRKFPSIPKKKLQRVGLERQRWGVGDEKETTFHNWAAERVESAPPTPPSQFCPSLRRARTGGLAHPLAREWREVHSYRREGRADDSSAQPIFSSRNDDRFQSDAAANRAAFARHRDYAAMKREKMESRSLRQSALRMRSISRG